MGRPRLIRQPPCFDHTTRAMRRRGFQALKAHEKARVAPGFTGGAVASVRYLPRVFGGGLIET